MDVAVVGAGPVGLLLAMELAMRGVRVSVLERFEAPDPTIKAGSINVASAEMLDRRGLRPALEEASGRMLETVRAAVRQVTTTAATDLLDRAASSRRRFPAVGHFAGMMFRADLVDQDDPIAAAHTRVADAVLVRQYDLELVLGARCRDLGVDVRRGVEVRGFAGGVRDDDRVALDTSAGEMRAAWVVAADGGRSVLRHALGIDLVGTEPQMVGYQALADLDGTEDLARGWTWTPRGVYSYGPVPDRILVARFGPQPADRDAPVTADELQEVLRDVTGTEVTVRGLCGRATRWSDNSRQATTYRSGRVLLAGDAAHVHPPFGGQGLNLGLGDAMNLGWKLAAVVSGDAADGLLASYEAERHPIAAGVLDWTRAQVALLRGDAWTEALRRVVDDRLLSTADGMTRMVAVSSGVTQRHALPGSGSVDPTGLVGTLVGDTALPTGEDLADRMHDGRFALVDRTADAGLAAIGTAADRVVHLVADQDGRPSVLVRPDGIIAWAGDGGPDDRRSLADALRRWGTATPCEVPQR